MRKPITFAGLLAALALALSPSAGAQPYSLTKSWTGSLTIPSDDANGVAPYVTINLPAFTSISSVQVSLDISGGYDGDYYAYLSGPNGGFSVLLNRMGVTSQNSIGSLASGLDVTFTDTGANGDGDIHLGPSSGGAVTGIWQPDARTAIPILGYANSVLDTSARTAFLSSFDGLNPNGNWTLFVADLAPGGVGTLDGWSVTVDGGPALVPDSPITSTALVTLALTCLWPVLRWRKGLKPQAAPRRVL
jgi:subtilisin-like proprotein convertase family protein